MGRTLILATCAAAFATAAFAQTAPRLDPAAIAARERDADYQAFEAKLRADLEARKRANQIAPAFSAGDFGTDVSVTLRADPPLLTPQQQACAARYKTYDPATNTYTARPGVRVRCTLGSGATARGGVSARTAIPY